MLPLAFYSDATPTRIFCLLAAAPVLEEVIFRTGIQQTLGRRLLTFGQAGAGLANLVTALLFAAAHLAMQATLSATATVLPALLIGAVYQRRRSLAPCIALHSLFNATWLLAGDALFNP